MFQDSWYFRNSNLSHKHLCSWNYLYTYLCQSPKDNFIANILESNFLYTNPSVIRYNKYNIVQFHYNGQFSLNYLQKTPHSSPVRVKFGMNFVGPDSDWYSAWVSAIIYAISYYIGPRYNGTQLYIEIICMPYHIMCYEHHMIMPSLIGTI